MRNGLLAIALLLTAASEGVVAQEYSVGAPAPLNNFAGTTAPVVTNDSSQGYSVGSLWLITSTGKLYVASSVAVGAAVWNLLN